jgi:GNAT superfamily N-acetyltransferase
VRVSDLRLRTPEEDDWPALLDLANRSVAGVAGATTQEQWVANRRSFAEVPGVQKHWVAADAATGEITGYVGVEFRSQDESGARLFVVVEPSQRDDVGARLLTHALDVARREGAADVWLIEYGGDDAFLAFLRAHGFSETRRFALADGAEACVMSLHVGG